MAWGRTPHSLIKKCCVLSTVLSSMGHRCTPPPRALTMEGPHIPPLNAARFSVTYCLQSNVEAPKTEEGEVMVSTTLYQQLLEQKVRGFSK